MVKRIQELELPGCAITEHGGCSGAVDFFQEMTKAKLTPILGNELYISALPATQKNKENMSLTHLPVLAKNYAGWRSLIALTSASNTSERFYKRPRLSLEELAVFLSEGNIIGFSGHPGSTMASILLDEADALLPDWKQLGERYAKYHEEIFGKGNFYIEIQLMDQSDMQKTLAGALREIAMSTGIPVVATPDAHYLRQSDAMDQRIKICRALNINLRQASQGKVAMDGFFRSKNYHIPSYKEMKQWHTEEELKNTIEIFEKCKSYDILSKPRLPKFACPEGFSEDEYLRHLCREGWARKVEGKVTDRQKYIDRIKFELSTLQADDVKLSSYFLIMADIIKYAKSNGWLVGPGRGSSAGCLTTYLTDITQVDPIRYNLFFERFWNPGRKGSLPDIDTDFPSFARPYIIEYIKGKYGIDKVGQIITYQAMKGRAAMKDVLRAYGQFSFDDMNRITKYIPEEASIADELQTMKEATGESSIIRWALENRADKFKDYCSIDDKGVVSGPLADKFEQAMRLEGVKTNVSRHASGVIISSEPLADICPMVYDTKSGNQLAGFEMNQLEAVGLLKLDVLSLRLLDKLMGVKDILQTGKINIENNKEHNDDTDDI